MHHRRATVVGVMLLAHALGAAADARAQAPAEWLAWRAPAPCPRGTDIEAEVARLLGRSLEEAVEPGFSASVSITVEGERARAEILFAGSSAVRTVEGESCRTLAEAIVIILAVAIDPERTAELLEAAAPPEQPVPEPAPPPPEPAPAFRIAIFGGAGASAGALPAVSAVLRLGVALDVGRFRVALAADYSLPRDQVVPDPLGDYGGRFDLLAGAVDGCYAVVRTASIDLRGCVRVEIGRLAGTGAGMDIAGATGTDPWVAAGASATFLYRFVPAFGLWIALEGVVALYRARFGIEMIGEIYLAGAGDGRALAGVEVGF